MLYVIDGLYYVKVGRKYINVDTNVVDNSLNLTPNSKRVIEDTNDLVISTISFKELEKEMLKQDSFDNDFTIRKRNSR